MNQFDLTDEELNELKYHLAERIVDNMTTKDLAQYVLDDTIQYFEKQSENDFMEEALNFWDDNIDDVIEDIRSYTKCDFKKTIKDGWQT